MSSKIYKFRPGSRVSGDPQVVGERLDQLTINGRLTAEGVLDDARAISSPLHSCFEWDDSTAAEAHRLWQARQLIACVITIETLLDQPRPVREYVAVHTPQERCYVQTEVALKDEDMRAVVLAQAERDFRSWEAKYQTLTELADIFAVAERVFVAQREREASHV